MALTQQQIEQARKAIGFTPAASPDSPIAKVASLREQAAAFDAEKEASKGFLERTAEDLKARGAGIMETMRKTAEGKINPLETGVRVVGDVAGGIGDVIAQAASPVIKPVIENIAQTDIGKAAFGALQQGMDSFETWKNSSEENKRLGEFLEGVGNIASLVPIGKGAQVGAKGAKIGFEGLEQGAKATERLTKNLITKVEPKPLTGVEAAKQVLQGKASEVAEGIRGLSQIDASNVKTYADLGGKIKTKITELAEQVDKDLALDTTKRKLDDLNIAATTKAGTTVQNNPVKTALSQLQELYQKTGDVVSEAEIKDLITQASTQGLNNLEINDLARLYGREFSEKAFGKVGEPLTSVNAQMYENTRSAIKDLARSGIKGKEAQAADKAMSSLYNTERLIKKNVEAVNKIRQKIQERGLLEKVGHFIAKTADILSGGTIRGMVGGILPRGAGYKVMNALDLEDILSKNLKILQEAIQSKSDDEIQKILKKLEL